MRIQIAFRNVLRNRRRTLLNVLMIAGGMSAIVVFQGFSQSMIHKMQLIAINTQYGHLQLATKKTWNLSAEDKPKDRLMDLGPELRARIEARPEVAYTSGRISFYGLISFGDQSVSAKGLGFDPASETQMKAQMRLVEGRVFESEAKFQIMIGVGLQKQLGLKVGEQIVILGHTFDGSVNALDSEVVGVFQTGLSEIDNSTFFVPLVTAQRLLDTEKIERLIIQLKSTDDTAALRGAIDDWVPADDPIDVRAWDELAESYRQVVQYFDVQNMVIQWIIMLLALLSIANTVGMSISERTGEIGTVRAMGDTRRTVLIDFLAEGFILGAIGGVVGAILGYLSSALVTALKIQIVMPGASLPVTIGVEVLPKAYLSSFLVMCLMAVLATLLPAYRASKLQIVEALKRNL